MKHVLTNLAELSGLLAVGIHRDRFSCETTNLFINTVL